MFWTLRWGRPRLRECHKLTPAEKWHLTARLQPFSPDSVASARRLMCALPIPRYLFWITLELAAHGSSNEGMVQPPTSGQMCLTDSHGILPWLIPELTHQCCQLSGNYHTTWSSSQHFGHRLKAWTGCVCANSSAVSPGLAVDPARWSYGIPEMALTCQLGQISENTGI